MEQQDDGSAALVDILRNHGGHCALTTIGAELKAANISYTGKLKDIISSFDNLLRLGRQGACDWVWLKKPAADAPAACCHWKRTGACDFGDRCVHLHDSSRAGCSKGATCPYGHAGRPGKSKPTPPPANKPVPGIALSTTLGAALAMAVQEHPGLTFEQLAKLHPRLEPIYALGGQPIEIFRKHPHIVDVVRIGSTDVLHPSRLKGGQQPSAAPVPAAANASSVVAPLPPSSLTSTPSMPTTTALHAFPPAAQHPASVPQSPAHSAPPAPGVTLNVPAGIRLVQQVDGTISLGPSMLTAAPAECLKALMELQPCVRFAVDCEGVNLSKEGRLTLVQIAVPSGAVYVFDVIALGSQPGARQVFVALLKALLEDAARVKVLHDCRQDASALHFHLGVTLNNVVDTQVLHGLSVEIEGMRAPLAELDGRRIGLNKLLTLANLAENRWKTDIHNRMEADELLWERRPLTAELLQYAAADVLQLLPLEEWLQQQIRIAVAAASSQLSAAQCRWFLTARRTAGNRPLDTTLALNIDPATNTASYEIAVDDGKEDRKDLPACARSDLDSELPLLLDVLPAALKTAISQLPKDKGLIEMLVSSHRAPVMRFADGSELDAETTISVDEAVQLVLGDRRPEHVFSTDNRAGLPGALHRISATRDRAGHIIALTYRIGRHVPGAAEFIRDLVASVGSQTSLLLLGPPGVGKTTLLRDVTRLLADEMRRRVVVVDTSNEIAGDHARPHSCIGRAHRMPVADRRRQHDVLIEAVQNQNPQVIVVDEIGTAEEVNAVRTIAQRGVGMVGTAHGISLQSLLKNPALRQLLGGVQAVILSASEAKQRNQHAGGSVTKTQIERAGAPAFEIVTDDGQSFARFYKHRSGEDGETWIDELRAAAASP